ncbi:hypothetical protein [Corynebacterium striatum]|uniref:hypothetical protein n=1 Tax=Corynebacterium striatum TaxID=43770 RepID=UPI003B5B8D66
MTFLHTVRVRKAWLENAVNEAGGIAALADKLDCAPSTISRQLNDKAEAGPRLIGSILTNYPASFEDVFDVTEEEMRTRRVRVRSAA